MSRDRARFDRDSLTFTPRAWGGLSTQERELVLDCLVWLAGKASCVGDTVYWDYATGQRMEAAMGRLRATILDQTLDEREFWEELWREQDPTTRWDDPREGLPPWPR